MTDSNKRSRTVVYQGTLPGWLGLLLLTPLLLVFFSLVATLLAGGAVAAFVLSFFVRHRLRGPIGPKNTDTIELDETQYTRVDPPRPRLSGD